MHFAGLNGSRSLRGQWSTFESNFSRQSSKSLQTTPTVPKQTISQYKVQIVGLDDRLSRGVAGFCGRQATY